MEIALNFPFTRKWNRSGFLVSKRATPTLGEHLNQAWSWSEDKRGRSGDTCTLPGIVVAEAQRLTMPNIAQSTRSGFVVARS